MKTSGVCSPAVARVFNMLSRTGVDDVITSSPPALELCGANAVFREDGRAVFTVTARTEKQIDAFLHGHTYSAAVAFVRGDFDVEGDLVRAIQWHMSQSRSPVREVPLSLGPERPAAATPSFPARSHLPETAPADRRSLSRYRLRLGRAALPCLRTLWRGRDGSTLSHSQAEFIGARRELSRIAPPVTVFESDFQQVHGSFDKIAPIGMFEHVGHRRPRACLSHIASLLTDQGLFLNHAIARPQNVNDGPETLFLQKYVFPGGDLLRLSK